MKLFRCDVCGRDVTNESQLEIVNVGALDTETLLMRTNYEMCKSCFDKYFFLRAEMTKPLRIEFRQIYAEAMLNLLENQGE